MCAECLGSDCVLLERWRCGDVGAGNALLERHAAALLRFFRRRVGAEADELVQSTMLACIESHQRIRGEATFRTYLFAIARHELYRFVRAHAGRRQRQLALDDVTLVAPEPSSAEQLAYVQRTMALQAALTCLSGEDQELLRRYYDEGLDSQVLAAACGLKPSSVRARLHRARKALARHMRHQRARSQHTTVSAIHARRHDAALGLAPISKPRSVA